MKGQAVTFHSLLIRLLLIVVMPGVILLPASLLFAEEDSFETQLEYLRSRDVAQVGRDSLAQAYEEFINKHAHDLRVAQAMLDIAALFTSVEMPEQNVHPDPEKALEWLRKAAAVAPEGSQTWIKAQFSIAGHVRRSDPALARAILQDVTARAKEKSALLQAQIEYELQRVCADEGNLDAAEIHCRRILEWYRDPNRIPKLELEKAEIDYIMISSAAFMVNTIQQSSRSTEERTDRIVKLMTDYAGFAALQREGTRALEDIKKEIIDQIIAPAEEYLKLIDDVILNHNPEAREPAKPPMADERPNQPASTSHGPPSGRPSQYPKPTTAPVSATLFWPLVLSVLVLLAAFALWQIHRTIRRGNHD